MGKKRENWPFRVGLILFIGQGFVFPMGSPFLLALVSVSSIACLITGLFRCAFSDTEGRRLWLYAFVTAVLILMAGRALFVVVESLTYDTSSDVHAENAILAAWGMTAVALICGIIRQIRRRIVTKAE